MLRRSLEHDRLCDVSLQGCVISFPMEVHAAAAQQGNCWFFLLKLADQGAHCSAAGSAKLRRFRIGRTDTHTFLDGAASTD